jgi:CRISPR-associated protein Cas2
MSQRRRYLVAYDVRDPARLRRTFRLLQGYGEHVQYSVFMCLLEPLQREQLAQSLAEVLSAREDRAMIVDLGPAAGAPSETMQILGSQAPLPAGEIAPTII